MAVAATINPSISPWSYKQLPGGVQPFTVEVRLTHDASAGNAVISVLFNPSAAQDFQRYVMVQHIYLLNSATSGHTSVVGAFGQWDKSIIRNVGIVNLTESESNGTSFVAQNNTWFYLGRSIAGSLGTLQFETLNTNGVVQDLTLTGLISEFPFVAPDLLRV